MDNTVITWKNSVDQWNADIFNKDTFNKDNVIITVETDNLPSPNDDNTISVKTISIDDIDTICKNDNFKDMSDLNNLNNIIKVIGWYTSNFDIDKNNYATFLHNMQWVCACITYFMSELNIQPIANKDSNELIRSSYKLCSQKSNCQYQYPDVGHKSANCKSQHFPYANLLLDCNSIVNYIKYHFEQSPINPNNAKIISGLQELNSLDNGINKQELKRCLTTINFVFIIIHRELDTVDKCRSCEPDYNIRKYHVYHQVHKPNRNLKKFTNRGDFLKQS